MLSQKQLYRHGAVTFIILDYKIRISSVEFCVCRAVAFITANPVTISPYICFKLLLIHPVIELLRQINFCMIVWEIVPEEVAVCLFPRSPVTSASSQPSCLQCWRLWRACFLFHVVGNMCLRKPSACAWLKSKLLFWSGHYRCCMHLAAAAGIM